MPNNLQGNIWKFGLILIANKRVFVAILGAFYLTIPNVEAAEIGLILFFGTLAGFLLEIPSGYFADTFGHRRTLILARTSMIISTLLFLVAHDLALLIAGGVFLSLAQALQSGTGSAFMHETLRGLGRERDYAHVMGKLSAVGFAFPIVFMVAVPFATAISMRLPFAVSLVFDCVGFIAALLLVEPPVRPQEVEEVRVGNVRRVLREGVRHNFYPLAVLSGAIAGITFAIGGFRAPYQVLLGVPVVWFGVLLGIGRALASLLLAYTGKLRSLLTLRQFYIVYVALVLVLTLMLTAHAATVVVVAFILINAVQWGFSRVDNSFLVEQIRESRLKATLLSIRNQFNQIVAAGASLFIGIVSSVYSYQVGFGVLGCIGLVVFVLLLLYVHRRY